jgi:hypothetical protein
MDKYRQPATPITPPAISTAAMDDFDDDVGDSSQYKNEDLSYLTQQIDVEAVLKRFENEILRGRIEEVNPQTGKVIFKLISPQDKPPVNELGVREILARMKARVTTIAKLSYKTEEEIYKDMFYFDMSITELIAKRSDKWEMDMEIAKSIKDATVELVWDVLASSRNGFTAINLRSQYQKQDISRTDYSTQQGGKTFLGIPIGGKR